MKRLLHLRLRRVREYAYGRRQFAIAINRNRPDVSEKSLCFWYPVCICLCDAFTLVLRRGGVWELKRSPVKTGRLRLAAGTTGRTEGAEGGICT